MDEAINLANNPGPSALIGWATSSAYVRTFETVLGRPAIVCTRAAAGPSIYIWYGRNTGLLTTSAATPTSMDGLPAVRPGETIYVSVDMGTDQTAARGFLNIRWFTAAGATNGVNASPILTMAKGAWQAFTLSAVAPANSAYFYVENVVQTATGNTAGGERAWAGRVYISTTPGAYFDGDRPNELMPGTLEWYAHIWLGDPGLSASARRRQSLRPWTRRWWDTLPSAYKLMDGRQPAGGGYNPLLRFMAGMGELAGEMRDLSDNGWQGRLTDVETAPDVSLRWMAQILGIPPAQRSLPANQLRDILRDFTMDGLPATGTRKSIADAARRFLTGNKQITVVPSSTREHTIVLLVVAEEVPGGNLDALAANVRATGVVPAGHALIAVNAQATWDSWEAAAGVTWDEVEAKTRTWSAADSLGVVLDETV